MPEISQATLVQWCVVWERADTDTRYGEPRLNAPINVRCRWNVTDQANPTQDQSQEQYPRTVPVGVEVKLGSIVWGPGKIKDLPNNPRSLPTYFEVVASSKTPDIKGRHPSYSVTLQKASKVLPDLVS